MEAISPLLQIALGLIACAFFYYLWKASHPKKNGKKESPEPAGRWPVIGHLLTLAGGQPVFRIFADLADKHGPIFTVWVGVHRTVIVNSWELAKECFTKNDRVLATRPPSAMGKYMGYNGAMFGLTPYGPYWRQIRKIVSLELLSARQLELLKHVRAKEIDLSVRDLYRQWKSNQLPIEVDMKQWFGDLAFNIISMSVAGKRYSGGTVIGDENEARKYRQVIQEFFYLGGLFLISDAIPYLECLDVGGHINAMKKVAKELDSFMAIWLEEHRRRRAFNPVRPDEDFIDVMLSGLEKSEFAGSDPDVVVKSTVLTLILAGTDTASITLTWALALLMHNQHILKKAQLELDSVVGKDRQVTESDIKSLPYLQSILKETLRLYPAAPLGAPRMTLGDCELGGYHLPAGTRLLVNLWKIHRDPRVWEDPLEFRPERFLTSHADMDVRGLNFELLPFGSGRRMCPGISFALQVMHLTLARLLQGFDITIKSGYHMDMSERIGITLQKITPLEVILTPRVPPSLNE